MRDIDDDVQLEDDFNFDSDFKGKENKKSFSLNFSDLNGGQAGKKFTLNFSEINKNDCFDNEFNKDIEFYSESWREQMKKDKRF